MAAVYSSMNVLFVVWPLVLAIPSILLGFPESLKGLLYMALPGGIIVGTITWFLTRRFFPQGPNHTSS